MNRRRASGLFLIINVVVSLSITLLAITFYNSTQNEDPTPRARPTIVVVYSPTPDPNEPLPAGALRATVDAQEGTIAAFEREVAAVQTAQSNPVAAANDVDTQNNGGGGGGIEPEAADIQRQDEDLPTIDPALLPDLPTGQAQVQFTALPADGCERYFVAQGDTAGAIATRLGVSQGELLTLNGLTTQSILSVGQELLVPGPGCEPPVTPTVTPTLQPTFDLNLTLVAPTTTLVATAVDSQIEIINVVNPGDVTSEQVELQNLGGEINLLGWTLTDDAGNVYTFPDVRLVTGTIIRVATRSDNNTPNFLYWNQNEALWEPGESATLRDASGVVQSVFTVPGEVIEFEDGFPDDNVP